MLASRDDVEKLSALMEKVAELESTLEEEVSSGSRGGGRASETKSALRKVMASSKVCLSRLEAQDREPV